MRALLLIPVAVLALLAVLWGRLEPMGEVTPSSTSTTVEAVCWQEETPAGFAQGCERPTTSTAPGEAVVPASQLGFRIPAPEPTPPPLLVSSTAYCEAGRMANGELAHDGAVSSKILPRGSSWRVLDGPMTGRTYVVKDTGSLAFFDISFPGRCDEAIQYGRRAIRIEEVR